MKNLFFSVVALAVLAVVANDSFAGCHGCGRSGLGLRSRSCNSSCASSCASGCSAKAPAAAPAAAPKAAAPAAAPKVESACASGSCGSCGLRGRLRLR